MTIEMKVMDMTDIVAEKLQLLPDSPGVYIMKDA